MESFPSVSPPSRISFCFAAGHPTEISFFVQTKYQENHTYPPLPQNFDSSSPQVKTSQYESILTQPGIGPFLTTSISTIKAISQLDISSKVHFHKPVDQNSIINIAMNLSSALHEFGAPNWVVLIWKLVDSLVFFKRSYLVQLNQVIQAVLDFFPLGEQLNQASSIAPFPNETNSDQVVQQILLQTQNLSQSIESHPFYWPCLYGLVLRGELIKALQLFERHSESTVGRPSDGKLDIFKHVLYLLGNYPQNNASLERFQSQWKKWNQACRSALPFAQNNPNIYHLLQILCGDQSIINVAAKPWIIRFIAHTLYVNPLIRQYPLYDYISRLVKDNPSSCFDPHLSKIVLHIFSNNNLHIPLFLDLILKYPEQDDIFSWPCWLSAHISLFCRANNLISNTVPYVTPFVSFLQNFSDADFQVYSKYLLYGNSPSETLYEIVSSYPHSFVHCIVDESKNSEEMFGEDENVIPDPANDLHTLIEFTKRIKAPSFIPASLCKTFAQYLLLNKKFGQSLWWFLHSIDFLQSDFDPNQIPTLIRNLLERVESLDNVKIQQMIYDFDSQNPLDPSISGQAKSSFDFVRLWLDFLNAYKKQDPSISSLLHSLIVSPHLSIIPKSWVDKLLEDYLPGVVLQFPTGFNQQQAVDLLDLSAQRSHSTFNPQRLSFNVRKSLVLSFSHHLLENANDTETYSPIEPLINSLNFSKNQKIATIRGKRERPLAADDF